MKNRIGPNAKANLPVLLLLLLELAGIGRDYLQHFELLRVSEGLFLWGVFDLLMGLSFAFGFENKAIQMTYTRNGGENYIQNLSGFIGASAKHFFTRDRDAFAGKKIALLGLGNMLLYFLIQISIKN